MSNDYYSKFELNKFNKRFQSFHKKEPYVFSVAAETEAGIGPYSSVSGPDVLPILAPSFTGQPVLSLDTTLPRYLLSFGINTNGSDITNIIISDNASPNTKYVIITGTAGTTNMSYTSNNATGTNVISLGSTTTGYTVPTPPLSTNGTNNVLNFTIPLIYSNTTTTSYSFKITATSSAGQTDSLPSNPQNISTIVQPTIGTITSTDTTMTVPFDIGTSTISSFVGKSFTITLSSTTPQTMTISAPTTGTSLSANFTGLTPGTSYSITVRATIPTILISALSGPVSFNTKSKTSLSSAPTASVSGSTPGKIQLSFVKPTTVSGSSIKNYSIIPYYTDSTGSIKYDPVMTVSATGTGVTETTSTGTNPVTTVTITMSSSDITKKFDISKLSSLNTSITATPTVPIGTLNAPTANNPTGITQPYAYVPLDNYPTNLKEGYKFKHSNTGSYIPHMPQVTGGYEIYAEYGPDNNYMLYVGSSVIGFVILCLLYMWYKKNNIKKFTI